MSITLSKITDYLGIQVTNSNIEINALNTIQDAQKNQLTFLENEKYAKYIKNSNASAILIKQKYINDLPKHIVPLVCDEPYISLAKISKLFAPNIYETNGPKLIKGKNSQIASNTNLGYGVNIGSNCVIMPGVYIGDNVTIGDNTIIYPNTVIYRDCVIGSNTIIHAGTVIGSDGFGIATTKNGEHIKIYQNGNTTIGSNVEIGANCTIDRAVFKSTIVENDVRIDNLVHIAHNCVVGKGSILAGQCGLAGSTKLNEYVVMAGQTGATGHLEIAPFTTIMARGVVSNNIKKPRTSWSGFPLMEHKYWLKLQSKINRYFK